MRPEHNCSFKFESAVLRKKSLRKAKELRQTEKSHEDFINPDLTLAEQTVQFNLRGLKRQAGFENPGKIIQNPKLESYGC